MVSAGAIVFFAVMVILGVVAAITLQHLGQVAKVLRGAAMEAAMYMQSEALQAHKMAEKQTGGLKSWSTKKEADAAAIVKQFVRIAKAASATEAELLEHGIDKAYI